MKLFTAWMEVLANIGVLVGIIFLTIEVSQNTLATKSEASLAIQTSISESISDVSSNPEVFDVIAKVYADEELTRKERLHNELYLVTHGTKFSRWNWKNQAHSFSSQMQRHVAEVIERETKNQT